jgi:hypothetical protein
MNYLDIVNSVLRRLRENEVSSVQETPYSKLIGDLVNVVKREVEDSWDWSALRTTLTANTTATLFNYELQGSTTRIRILDMFNDTDNIIMQQRSTKWFDIQFLLTNPETGSPYYYNFNGVSPDGDTQVDFYPIPDGVYNIRINCIIPQDKLSLNTDRILIPADVVIEGTISRAISERGDDGGNVEHEMRYRSMLADYIAIESGQRMDEITWSPY